MMELRIKPKLIKTLLTGKCPASPVLQDGVKGHNMMKPPCRKALPLSAGIFILLCLAIWFVSAAFSFETITTKVIVRVVARDAQVIGSGVGGALVRIKNLETGEILAEGKQEGGTGSTERIMVQPRRRGETVYGTIGSASFEAKIPLDRPTQVKIDAEAPLRYPQAIQRGSKTLTLIPGKDVTGEGIVIELNGLIVNVLSPSSNESLKGEETLSVKAEVRML